MKKVIIKSGVFILVFVMTMIITGKLMNRGNNDMTMEMAPATLPVVTFLQGEYRINELHGHTVKMDVSSMASNMVQLGEEREVSFLIDRYDALIADVSLEVRSCDGERLIEKIDVAEYADEGTLLRVDTKLKDLLEEDTEYALVVVITDGDGREIRYYTRCIWGTERFAEEKLAFVKEFHESTFDEGRLDDLKKYMESNSSGDNSTLHKVNIHSSLSQLGWGELAVSQVTEPVIHIMELGRDTGSFILKTMVSTGEGSQVNYYTVEEYYRIRYTASRVYLLDFERTMTQLPEVEGDIYANDKIMLGIVGEEIRIRENTNGNFLIFETAGRLCSYNVQNNKMSLLHSFYDRENWDARTLYDAHDVKILSVDDAGNAKFGVYGYFNRGRHEGETGIGVYAYDSALNTLEELIFIPYGKSWEILKNDVEKLCFLNPGGKLYVYLNQNIHQVELETGEDTVLARLDGDGVIYTSDDHRILLWNQENLLQVRNLESERGHKISVNESERIQALGFMGSDVIYGVVRDSDIVKDASGKDILPMYKVVICDASGNILKEYQEENVYTLNVDVVANQITLNRVKKDGNGSYEDTIPEHIVNNEEIAAGKNKVVTAVVDIYETVTQIQVKKSIDSRTIQILTPKEVVFEGDRMAEIQENQNDHKLYYVYNQYGMDEVYFDPAAAVLQAYETSGRVVDETGRTVWFKGNRLTRNQIMAITEPEKTSASASLASCLDTILKFEGITAQTGLILEEGKNALEILQEQLVNAHVADLTGCPMDAMLYFVNKDIPVLGILADGEAVLITGFNEFNIVVFEPSSGKLYKKGMNDSAAWFAENGNRFITYFEE